MTWFAGLAWLAGRSPEVDVHLGARGDHPLDSAERTDGADSLPFVPGLSEMPRPEFAKIELPSIALPVPLQIATPLGCCERWRSRRPCPERCPRFDSLLRHFPRSY